MKNKEKKNDSNNFLNDYNKIVNTNNMLSLNRVEWIKNGDYFQKFTMYNTNYKTIQNIKTIGSTTLINKL